MPLSQLLFSFNGRLNRKPYWLTVLAMVAVVLVVIFIVMMIVGGVAGLGAVGGGSSLMGLYVLLVIIYIPFLWVGLALAAKRLHDRNKSAWWLLLFALVPAVLQGVGELLGTAGLVLSLAALAVSLWGLVEIGFLRGTVGPNQYGPDPLAGRV